ncbi:conserved hypothetical protein [Neospora caninum Liverpool]|uniref:Uncharacterized protein n=1 Tax=Neospora caninum (strain Liverpool) TaxID=572307 RepID=F0VMX6_NEOCL|nr:conserved hypothetical protein [Neospora caninum Liverpool]CBZ55072.1 conserved hypothetical protein [Neospora caninum Liverpool]|eukprot:XP_003885100.1 conserved hypothetical protein [Neospora caninum Liverpool]
MMPGGSPVPSPAPRTGLLYRPNPASKFLEALKRHTEEAENKKLFDSVPLFPLPSATSTVYTDTVVTIHPLGASTARLEVWNPKQPAYPILLLWVSLGKQGELLLPFAWIHQISVTFVPRVSSLQTKLGVPQNRYVVRVSSRLLHPQSKRVLVGAALSTAAVHPIFAAHNFLVVRLPAETNSGSGKEGDYQTYLLEKEVPSAAPPKPTSTRATRPAPPASQSSPFLSPGRVPGGRSAGANFGVEPDASGAVGNSVTPRFPSARSVVSLQIPESSSAPFSAFRSAAPVPSAFPRPTGQSSQREQGGTTHIERSILEHINDIARCSSGSLGGGRPTLELAAFLQGDPQARLHWTSLPYLRADGPPGTVAARPYCVETAPIDFGHPGQRTSDLHGHLKAIEETFEEEREARKAKREKLRARSAECRDESKAQSKAEKKLEAKHSRDPAASAPSQMAPGAYTLDTGSAGPGTPSFADVGRGQYFLSTPVSPSGSYRGDSARMSRRGAPSPLMSERSMGSRADQAFYSRGYDSMVREKSGVHWRDEDAYFREGLSGDLGSSVSRLYTGRQSRSAGWMPARSFGSSFDTTRSFTGMGVGKDRSFRATSNDYSSTDEGDREAWPSGDFAEGWAVFERARRRWLRRRPRDEDDESGEDGGRLPNPAMPSPVLLNYLQRMQLKEQRLKDRIAALNRAVPSQETKVAFDSLFGRWMKATKPPVSVAIDDLVDQLLYTIPAGTFLAGRASKARSLRPRENHRGQAKRVDTETGVRSRLQFYEDLAEKLETKQRRDREVEKKKKAKADNQSDGPKQGTRRPLTERVFGQHLGSETEPQQRPSDPSFATRSQALLARRRATSSARPQPDWSPRTVSHSASLVRFEAPSPLFTASPAHGRAFFEDAGGRSLPSPESAPGKTQQRRRPGEHAREETACATAKPRGGSAPRLAPAPRTLMDWKKGGRGSESDVAERVQVPWASDHELDCGDTSISSESGDLPRGVAGASAVRRTSREKRRSGDGQREKRVESDDAEATRGPSVDRGDTRGASPLAWSRAGPRGGARVRSHRSRTSDGDKRFQTLSLLLPESAQGDGGRAALKIHVELSVNPDGGPAEVTSSVPDAPPSASRPTRCRLRSNSRASSCVDDEATYARDEERWRRFTAALQSITRDLAGLSGPSREGSPASRRQKSRRRRWGARSDSPDTSRQGTSDKTRASPLWKREWARTASMGVAPRSHPSVRAAGSRLHRLADPPTPVSSRESSTRGLSTNRESEGSWFSTRGSSMQSSPSSSLSSPAFRSDALRASHKDEVLADANHEAVRLSTARSRTQPRPTAYTKDSLFYSAPPSVRVHGQGETVPQDQGATRQPPAASPSSPSKAGEPGVSKHVAVPAELRASPTAAKAKGEPLQKGGQDASPASTADPQATDQQAGVAQVPQASQQPARKGPPPKKPLPKYKAKTKLPAPPALRECVRSLSFRSFSRMQSEKKEQANAASNQAEADDQAGGASETAPPTSDPQGAPSKAAAGKTAESLKDAKKEASQGAEAGKAGVPKEESRQEASASPGEKEKARPTEPGEDKGGATAPVAATGEREKPQEDENLRKAIAAAEKGKREADAAFEAVMRWTDVYRNQMEAKELNKPPTAKSAEQTDAVPGRDHLLVSSAEIEQAASAMAAAKERRRRASVSTSPSSGYARASSVPLEVNVPFHPLRKKPVPTKAPSPTNLLPSRPPKSRAKQRSVPDTPLEKCLRGINEFLTNTSKFPRQTEAMFRGSEGEKKRRELEKQTQLLVEAIRAAADEGGVVYAEKLKELMDAAQDVAHALDVHAASAAEGLRYVERDRGGPSEPEATARDSAKSTQDAGREPASRTKGEKREGRKLRQKQTPAAKRKELVDFCEDQTSNMTVDQIAERANRALYRSVSVILTESLRATRRACFVMDGGFRVWEQLPALPASIPVRPPEEVEDTVTSAVVQFNVLRKRVEKEAKAFEEEGFSDASTEPTTGGGSRFRSRSRREEEGGPSIFGRGVMLREIADRLKSPSETERRRAYRTLEKMLRRCLKETRFASEPVDDDVLGPSEFERQLAMYRAIERNSIMQQLREICISGKIKAEAWVDTDPTSDDDRDSHFTYRSSRVLPTSAVSGEASRDGGIAKARLFTNGGYGAERNLGDFGFGAGAKEAAGMRGGGTVLSLSVPGSPVYHSTPTRSPPKRKSPASTAPFQGNIGKATNRPAQTSRVQTEVRQAPAPFHPPLEELLKQPVVPTNANVYQIVAHAAEDITGPSQAVPRSPPRLDLAPSSLSSQGASSARKGVAPGEISSPRSGVATPPAELYAERVPVSSPVKGGREVSPRDQTGTDVTGATGRERDTSGRRSTSGGVLPLSGDSLRGGGDKGSGRGSGRAWSRSSGRASGANYRGDENPILGAPSDRVLVRHPSSWRTCFKHAREDASKAPDFLLLNVPSKQHGASAQRSRFRHTTSRLRSRTSRSVGLGRAARDGANRRAGSKLHGAKYGPQRGPTVVDERRISNLKFVDPLDFKPPPRKKKLADTDWAKYGRPAPRIAREQREQLRPQVTADADLDAFDWALDKIYHIVVGGHPDEAEKKENEGLLKDASSPDGSPPEDKDKTTTPAEHPGPDGTAPVISVTAASPLEPQSPASPQPPKTPNAVHDHKFVAAATETPFGKLGRPEVPRRPRKSVATQAGLLSTRQATLKLLSTKPLDLSKVQNRHKGAPVPNLSPEELKQLELESDLEDDFSYRSGRPTPGGAACTLLLPPDSKVSAQRLPSPRSERSMLQDLKEGIQRGEEAFPIVGRAADPRVLAKAKREGKQINEAEKEKVPTVKVPLTLLESLREEITGNEGMPFTQLYEVPGYPGVKGNFDGLWRIWLQQRDRDHQVGAWLTDSAPERVGKGYNLPPSGLWQQEMFNPSFSRSTSPNYPASVGLQPEAPMTDHLGVPTYHVSLRNQASIGVPRGGYPPSGSGYENSALSYDVVRVPDANLFEGVGGAQQQEMFGRERVMTTYPGLSNPMNETSESHLPATIDPGRNPLARVYYGQAANQCDVDNRAIQGPFPGSELNRSFDIFWERMQANDMFSKRT